VTGLVFEQTDPDFFVSVRYFLVFRVFETFAVHQHLSQQNVRGLFALSVGVRSAHKGADFLVVSVFLKLNAAIVFVMCIESRG
jgi:hypothetical protein